jgi:hypothetical protein
LEIPVEIKPVMIAQSVPQIERQSIRPDTAKNASFGAFFERVAVIFMRMEDFCWKEEEFTCHFVTQNFRVTTEKHLVILS